MRNRNRLLQIHLISTCRLGFFFQLDRTALHWAAANGNIDVIEKLVEDGADLESKDKVPVLWVKS